MAPRIYPTGVTLYDPTRAWNRDGALRRAHGGDRHECVPASRSGSLTESTEKDETA